MKLYIKRIAQAALITSAVAVAGSAFAMASSNVAEGSGYTCNKKTTFNQVYLTTDGKPYWWVFAFNSAASFFCCFVFWFKRDGGTAIFSVFLLDSRFIGA